MVMKAQVNYALHLDLLHLCSLLELIRVHWRLVYLILISVHRGA